MTNTNLIKKANKLKREGKLEEAINLYRQIIEINPHFAWAYYNLGDALVKQGKPDEAVAFYSKSLKFNSNSAWLFYSLGEALAQHGDLPSTVEYLQKAIDIKPDFYRFYNFLGFILAYHNNNLDEAIVNIYKSLQLNSNCWHSHYLLSEFLIKKGDFYEAINHYIKAININPGITQESLIYKNKSNFPALLEKTDFKRDLLEKIKSLQIKKILLTNHYFNIYAGSELVTLYLAQIFSGIGLNVTIASFVTGEPMISTIASHNIELINVIDNPLQIKQRKFDLAWCHHFPVIDYCVNDLGVDANFMVYSSLSPYEPLEKITYLETSDVMIFNSKENQCIQASDLDEKYQQKICVFNNSLPEDWFLNLKPSVCYHKEQHLLPQNIAVISNHIPPEIKKLSDLLISDHGIQVKCIGLENKQELVTPRLIDTYDAVITIGHTVQKAMSRKIPVYCYDRFGGPGWITKDNLIDAEYFNFSGRCCNRKLNAEYIRDEILQGYKTAIESLNYLFHYSKFAYSIEVNVLTVLQKLKLSDTTFAEKLSTHSLESYQIRKISQLYTYNKFNAGSKTTLVYLNKNDRSKLFFKFNIQILNVINFYENDQTLLWGFNIESPVKSQIIYECEVPVFGWVLGKKSPVVAVEVISNNTVVQKVSINQPRPDVARVYSHVPDAEMSGFQTIVNIGELLKEGELLIQAVCSDESCVALSKIQF